MPPNKRPRKNGYVQDSVVSRVNGLTNSGLITALLELEMELTLTVSHHRSTAGCHTNPAQTLQVMVSGLVQCSDHQLAPASLGFLNLGLNLIS